MGRLEFFGRDGSLLCFDDILDDDAGTTGELDIGDAELSRAGAGRTAYTLAWAHRMGPAALLLGPPVELAHLVASHAQALAGARMFRLRQLAPLPAADNRPRPPQASSLSDLLPPAPVQPQRTWVGFQLLDAQGSPVPDAAYEITCSDGSTLAGTTDGNGAARHDDVPAGSCTVAFASLTAALGRSQR